MKFFSDSHLTFFTPLTFQRFVHCVGLLDFLCFWWWGPLSPSWVSVSSTDKSFPHSGSHPDILLWYNFHLYKPLVILGHFFFGLTSSWEWFYITFTSFSKLTSSLFSVCWSCLVSKFEPFLSHVPSFCLSPIFFIRWFGMTLISYGLEHLLHFVSVYDTLVFHLTVSIYVLFVFLINNTKLSIIFHIVKFFFIFFCSHVILQTFCLLFS